MPACDLKLYESDDIDIVYPYVRKSKFSTKILQD